MTKPSNRINPVIWAVLLSAIIVVPRAILIQANHSESSDDDYHLVRGLEFLNRDPGLVHRELNDPPLGEALAAMPLWIMGGTTHGPDEGTALYDQKYSPEAALLAIAVWKSLLFLPLIAVAFAWCGRLYGQWAGWLAVAFLTLEPTFTAHLHLAALDVIATTAIVISSWLVWRYFEAPSRSRLFLASLSCAAALLIKHTAAALPVIVIAFALADGIRHRRIAANIVSFLGGLLLTLLLMWALLGFDMSPVRKGNLWPGGIYVGSVLDAAKHVREPNDAFLNGETRRGGWWYYFPVVASYKVPLSVAAVLLLGLASTLRKRPTFPELSLVLPMIVFTAMLLLQTINIGWRHFLPAYVFMLLASTRFLSLTRPWQTLGVALACALAVASTPWISTGVAYHNLLRPDPEKAISDSNLDWGQSLPEVRRWIDGNQALIAGRPVYLRAFATRRRAIRYYLGDRVIVLNHADPAPQAGVLIVSAVSLTGIGESADEYAQFRQRKPDALIGQTMHVFFLTPRQ